MPQPSLSTYHPSLGERLQQGISGLLGKVVNQRYANHLGERLLGFANDLTPVGNVTMAADAGTAIRNGHPFKGAGLGALAIVPGAVKRGGMFAARKAIKAYHGSPHDFEKFSMARIGAGEGAQGQGHGLYFASNKPSAKWYADTYGGGSGRLYEVQIGADPADLLDWNANLGDMPAPLKDRVRAVIPDAPWDENGMALYARAKQMYGTPEAASKALLQAGIPGVRYQGQRGTNYSVFDDSLINILNKF